MSITNTFEELSDLLRRIESGGWEIAYVETNEEKLRAGDPLSVTVGVSSPLFDTLQKETNVRIEGPDVEQATTVLEVTIPPGEEDANVESSTEENRPETENVASSDRLSDGCGELQSRRPSAELEDPPTSEVKDSPSAHDETEESTASDDVEERTTLARDDNSKPAHHDPERLREAYEEHDTFAEMTDALGVDVSPQTVRHFMIRHGVHEPASHSSSTSTDTETDPDPEAEREETDRTGDVDAESDEEDEERETDASEDEGEQESTDDGDTPSSDRPTSGNGNEPDPVDEPEPEAEDSPTPASNGDIDVEQLEGVELPDGVSIGDVKSAVQSSSTAHEVSRELDLDSGTTREMLRDLDLLDLVTGRLASKPNQDKPLDQIETATDSTEEIEKRIRSALSYPSTTTGTRQQRTADVGSNYNNYSLD